MVNCKAVAAALALALAALCARADADPGMTWTQERAWLASNDFVNWRTIDKGYDKAAGVTVGTATIPGIANKDWVVHAVLDKNDVVTEETYTFASTAESSQWDARTEKILVARMYGATPLADEYASAAQVATVAIYNDPGKEEFYAAQGGKYGFMVDPYEFVVFRASELDERIKQAQYCSTHKECGE